MKRVTRALVAGGLLGLAAGATSAHAKDSTIGVSFDKIEPFRVAEQKAITDAVAAAARR